MQKVRRFEIISYLVIAVMTVALLLVTRKSTHSALQSAEESFRRERIAEVEVVKLRIEHTIRQIYEGIRTVALLPAVKQLSIENSKLSVDGALTIQQVYNNLAASVKMSEVYITPKDFDPDGDDMKNSVREPLVTYDQLIVGNYVGGAASKESHGQTSRKAKSSKPDETEIYEYRLIKEQLKWFSEHYPDSSTINKLDFPMYIGPEVITCDNSRFDPEHPSDSDRSGFVLSVPFFNERGQFQGQVSGIILSGALRELLPDKEFWIYNSVANSDLPNWSSSSNLKNDKSDTLFLISTPLEFGDHSLNWQLSSVALRSEFNMRPEVQAALQVSGVSRLAVLFFALTLTTIIRSVANDSRLGAARLSDLDRKVLERTKELELANQELHALYRQSQALSVQAQDAAKSKGHFLANMSHEIRTPLNGIIGLTEIVLSGPLNKDQREELGMVRDSSEHLLRIINDILDFSKLESGKLKFEQVKISLSKSIELVRGVLQTKIADNHQTLITNIAPEVPKYLVGDEIRIQQILLNLIGNAIKFSPQNGVILVNVTLDSVVDGVCEICLAVVDNGVGISKEDIGRVLLPFEQADVSTTRKFGGTGLGLSIVNQLTQAMGGRMEVTSQPGVGSCFKAFLMLPEYKEVVSEARAEANIFTGEEDHVISKLLDRKINLLIVEDNLVNQRLMNRLLAGKGWNITVTSNGQEAIQAVESSAGHGKPFDIILMDCQMPVMDGYEASRILKERNSGVPIVALTAHAMSGDMERCYEAGMVGFVPKPLDKKRLYLEMARVLINSSGKA